MTRMNYGLNHSRDLTERPATGKDRQRIAKSRIRKSKPTFHIKYATSCSNCHKFMPVGTIATFSIKKKIVHGAGCLRK